MKLEITVPEQFGYADKMGFNKKYPRWRLPVPRKGDYIRIDEGMYKRNVRVDKVIFDSIDNIVKIHASY